MAKLIPFRRRPVRRVYRSVPGVRQHLRGFGELSLQEAQAVAARVVAQGAPHELMVTEFQGLAFSSERDLLAGEFIKAGVPSESVIHALDEANQDILPKREPTPLFWRIASTASMVVSVYHGYKRNESVGWAIWWGVTGALFPIVVPAIAVAQGYGKPREGLRRAQLREATA